MLRKRISTLALVVMMGASVVGCQSSKEQQLENRVQQLEQQLEEQQEKDAENVTAGEYLEQHKGDVSAEIDTTRTGKTRADGRKARYTANGVFVGYFTDAEVKQLNKGIQEAIDKEFKRQQNTTKQDDNTNSNVDERNNYKPADNNYEEDYWKTDGDLPNGDYDDNDEPAIIEEQEDMRPECEKEYTPKVQEEEGEPEPELPPYVNENSKVTSDGNGNITITEPEVTE